jgi:putative nucleotidyltransferase with HDIG domain
MSSPPQTLRAHAEVSVREQLKRLRGALEEGRLLRARLEALENVALAVQAKTPLRETLDQILFHLREPLGCRFGFLMLLSDRPGRSHVEVFHGFEEDADLRTLLVERIVRPVTAEGSPLLVRETAREARYAELANYAARVGSAAIFPLAGGARPLGVVGLMTAPDRPRVTEDDLGFLSIAATSMHGLLNESTSRRANLHLLTRMVRPLTAALEARDPYTRGHSERVAKYALAVVHELEMAGKIEFSEEFRVTVRLAAFLHDIGKIGVGDAILQKPGHLTEEEFAIIKTHTLKGAQILDGLSELADVIPGVVSHHERWNGTGYPHGLKGAEIPLLGKVLGIADSLDAMITDRPYKKGIPIDETMKTLKGLAGTQFDPEIVSALVAAHRSGLLEEDRSEEEALGGAEGDYVAIEKIFSREIHELPALPQIITQVLERTRDPKTPVREIVRLVSRDQALVIRILRLVNSAYYGFARKIATINLAVAILGYRAVQNLVLNVGVVGVFREIMRSRNERRVALFEHSMECAVLAKTLALKLPSLDVQQDEAFTAGLLHDIGKIVLEQYAKDAATQVSAVMAEKGVTELEAEAEVLGVDHAAIGEWIAMRWNIPARLREAILYHHRPFVAREQAPALFNLVKTIALANRIYYLAREVSGPDEIVAGLATSSLSEPGLTPEALAEILKAVEAEKREFRDILSAGDAKSAA